MSSIFLDYDGSSCARNLLAYLTYLSGCQKGLNEYELVNVRGKATPGPYSMMNIQAYCTVPCFAVVYCYAYKSEVISFDCDIAEKEALNGGLRMPRFSEGYQR